MKKQTTTHFVEKVSVDYESDLEAIANGNTPISFSELVANDNFPETKKSYLNFLERFERFATEYQSFLDGLRDEMGVKPFEPYVERKTFGNALDNQQDCTNNALRLTGILRELHSSINEKRQPLDKVREQYCEQKPSKQNPCVYEFELSEKNKFGDYGRTICTELISGLSHPCDFQFGYDGSNASHIHQLLTRTTLPKNESRPNIHLGKFFFQVGDENEPRLVYRPEEFQKRKEEDERNMVSGSIDIAFITVEGMKVYDPLPKYFQDEAESLISHHNELYDAYYGKMYEKINVARKSRWRNFKNA